MGVIKLLGEAWFVYGMTAIIKTEFCSWYYFLAATALFVPYLFSSLIGNKFLIFVGLFLGIGGTSSTNMTVTEMNDTLFNYLNNNNS